MSAEELGASLEACGVDAAEAIVHGDGDVLGYGDVKLYGIGEFAEDVEVPLGIRGADLDAARSLCDGDGDLLAEVGVGGANGGTHVDLGAGCRMDSDCAEL